MKFNPKSAQDIQSEDEARNTAIDWANWQSKQSMSYGEVGYWQNYFEALAENYPNLKEEFEENGII